MLNDDLVALAISRAMNLSSRSSFSWMIVDEQQRVLNCDAVMAGVEPLQLASAIDQYSQEAEKIFLSIEPTSSIVDVTSLTSMLDQSNIQDVYLGRAWSPDRADQAWLRWINSWEGNTHILSPSASLERINFSIEKVLCRGYPWLTCVTAASLMGAHVDFDSLADDFGLIHHINQLIGQSRAVIYTPSQRKVMERFARSNNMGEEVEWIELSDLQSLDSLLRFFTRDKRFHVVLIGDLVSLGYCLQNDLVDDVVHHVAHGAGNGELTKDMSLCLALNMLKDWNLIASEVVGETSRLHYCRSTGSTGLGRWSN